MVAQLGHPHTMCIANIVVLTIIKWLNLEIGPTKKTMTKKNEKLEKRIPSVQAITNKSDELPFTPPPTFGNHRMVV